MFFVQEMTNAISAAKVEVRTSAGKKDTAYGGGSITLLETVLTEFGPRQSQSPPPQPLEMGDFLLADIACCNRLYPRFCVECREEKRGHWDLLGIMMSVSRGW